MQSNAEAAFTDFLEALLKQAELWAANEGIPIRTRYQLSFLDSQRSTRGFVQEDDFISLLLKHREIIIKMPQTLSCIKVLWDEGLIKYLLPRKDRENILGILNDEQVSTIASYLFYAGIDLLDNYRSFHPNSEQIHETFERFIKSWNAVSISETAIFPLINFKSNKQDAIQIGRSYSISPFVSKEKTVFWDIVDEFHSRDSFSYFNFQQIGYKLSGTRVYPYPERSNLDENSIGIEIGISQNTMLMEVRDILSALRLNKEGDVAVTNYIEQSDEVLPRRNTSMGRPELLSLIHI